MMLTRVPQCSSKGRRTRPPAKRVSYSVLTKPKVPAKARQRWPAVRTVICAAQWMLCAKNCVQCAA